MAAARAARGVHVKHQPRNLTSPEREITAAALGRIHSVLELSRRTPVLRSLDELRRCTVPAMRAGYEFFQRDKHKMNNGVLLARKGARFLSLWRDSYRQYRRDVWDHNSCIASYELAARHPELVHLDPDLAPLTRYGKREHYLRHLERARVRAHHRPLQRAVAAGGHAAAPDHAQRQRARAGGGGGGAADRRDPGRSDRQFASSSCASTCNGAR